MTKTYDIVSSPFAENVYKRVQGVKENIYIALPATVVGVEDYETLQCIDVKPVINDIFTKKDATVLESRTLRKIFVKLIDTGGFRVKLPVEKGNLVTLHWSHKDLSKWLDGDGSNVNQSVTETAELGDCWAELGFGTRKNNTSPSLTDLIIESDKTNITITPSGKVNILTEGDINIETSGNSTLKSSLHTIDTDTIITGNLTVEQNTTVEGDLSITGTTTSTGIVNALGGVFAASYAGVGGGAATFNVDMNVTGTVTINGVNLNTHIHVDSQGGNTSPPQ